MAEISFVVNQTALDVVRNTSIDANFDACEAALKEMMAPYKSLVVTEDGLAGAKSDRARIRKVQSSIDEVRKQVKRIYTAPLSEFEDKCKKLTAICAESADNLDGQIKEYDELRREEKMNDLRDFFNANATSDATEFISFDAICNPRWGNATYSEEDAHKEILREIAACVTSVNAIRTLKSPMEAALLDYYRQTRDLPACIAKHEHLMRLREQEERRKAEIERLRQEQEQRERARAEAENPQEIVESGAEPIPAAADAAEEPTYTLDFRVVVTAQQGAALKAFLKSNGIQYMPVPKE